MPVSYLIADLRRHEAMPLLKGYLYHLAGRRVHSDHQPVILVEQDVYKRQPLQHLIHSFYIHGSILADGGMGTASGFHADDALLGQYTVPGQKLRVLFRINIIGNDS